MLYFPRWKVLGITLLCVLGVLLAVPSLVPQSVALPRWADAVRINLGLDLAGGSHLLLEAETPDVARQRLEGMEDLIRR
jgi:preprotein translocase subunit SecD